MLATPEYYKHVFSTKAFDGILRGEKPVIYGKNLNVTSYTQPQAKQAGNRKNAGNEEEDEGDAGRKNHDPVGRAHAPGLATHAIIFVASCKQISKSAKLVKTPISVVPLALCPTVQFSNLADFCVYITLKSLSKINLYHRMKLLSRSARFSDNWQI